MPDDLDAAALALLLDEVVRTARPACAAVFSGWRALDVPTTPKAHAAHQVNALRELPTACTAPRWSRRASRPMRRCR